MKEVCKKLQIDTKNLKEKAILGKISACKDELIGAEQFLKENPWVKGIVRGEGEVTFCELVSSYVDKEKKLSDICGLTYVSKGEIHSNPDIYKIPVVLPNNPLKILNSYVIKTPQGNLVMDTGFRQPECLEALTEGLKDLEIDMDNTTLFLSHLHSDHVGLTNDIITDKTRVLINEKDYNYNSYVVDRVFGNILHGR